MATNYSKTRHKLLFLMSSGFHSTTINSTTYTKPALVITLYTFEKQIPYYHCFFQQQVFKYTYSRFLCCFKKLPTNIVQLASNVVPVRCLLHLFWTLLVIPSRLQAHTTADTPTCSSELLASSHVF